MLETDEVIFSGQMHLLTPNQKCQSTEKHVPPAPPRINILHQQKYLEDKQSVAKWETLILTMSCLMSDIFCWVLVSIRTSCKSFVNLDSSCCDST